VTDLADESSTPFAPSAAPSLEDVVRAWLDLSPEAELHVSLPPTSPLAPIGHMVVEIVLGGTAVELDVRDAQPGSRSWRASGGLQVSYRLLRDGQDPLAHPPTAAQMARIGARLDGLGATEASSWVERLTGSRPPAGHSPLPDWMYRSISAGDKGRYATLRLSFRCNQDCSFCWQGRDWPDVPEDLYVRWLDEFAAAGIAHVCITGGEPTLQPILPALVERARRTHRMHVQLETNAIRLGEPRYVRRLADAGLSSVFISYHSADPETSDRMTRAPGTHRKTVAGIHGALDAGLPVILNCVVERANVTALAGHAADVVERFVTPHADNPVRRVAYSNPCAYYDPASWRAALVPLDEVRPYLLSAARLLDRAGVQLDLIGTCGFPPCLFRDEPRFMRALRRDGLAEQDLAARGYVEPCERCAVKPECLGVRNEYIETFGSRGIEPFPSRPDPTACGAPTAYRS
jgi:pyruvate-formate lyase-activating enzyme